MRLIALTFLFLGLYALPSGAQECQRVRGIPLPCSSTPVPPGPPLPAVPAPPLLPDPLFTPEHVARDTPPEWLALLNAPTWANAVRYTQVYLYRQYRYEMAQRLWLAAQHAIETDIEQQTGFTLTGNRLPFLQEFARLWGLPLTDLSHVPPVPVGTLSPADKATAALLADALRKGQ